MNSRLNATKQSLVDDLQQLQENRQQNINVAAANNVIAVAINNAFNAGQNKFEQNQKAQKA